MKSAKAKIAIITIACCLLIAGCVLAIVFATKNDDANSQTLPAKGVWWWSVTQPDEVYLNFAKENGVNEIYYSNSAFDEQVNEFISQANQFDIKVFFLCGEYQWIQNPADFEEVVEQYQTYQNNFENKFSGIHLDVEPHQSPEWSGADQSTREQIVTDYLGFVRSATQNQKFSDISFDFDIPFWFDDYVVDFQGERKEAFKFVIDFADRVFVMSYRDEATRIFDSAKNELLYAKDQNATLFFCVETALSSEGDDITFFEEGKAVMNAELETLAQLITNECGQDFVNYGISIHHMRTWFDLKD